MEPFSKCMICGTAITPTFWVCAPCERAYGLGVPFTSWPNWAKALKDEEEKERRRNARWREYTVISLDEVEVLERIVYGDCNNDPIGERFLAG